MQIKFFPEFYNLPCKLIKPEEGVMELQFMANWSEVCRPQTWDLQLISEVNDGSLVGLSP